MSNPLEKMAEIYQEQVEKADKNNTANLYKNTFIMVKQALEKEYGFKIINEEYLDGYLIFGHGTNSVVHFEVKECKGWKFGVWWSYKPDEKRNLLKGEFFCQHERYLDKFKPSRGAYNYDMVFNVEDEYEPVNVGRFDVAGLMRICEFIKNHPYIAAMKDFHYIDYNTQVQRPVKAFVEYWVDGVKLWIHNTVEGTLEKRMSKMLEYWGKKICEENEGYTWEVLDMEEYCSPRYELAIKIPDGDEQETGCFGFFENKEDQKKWDRECEMLEKIGKLFGCWWHSNCGANDTVIFWKEGEADE